MSKSKPSDAEVKHAIADIRAKFLAGATLADVQETYRESEIIPLSHIAEYRNALFDELQSSPQRLRELANGPILNPLDIVHYKGMKRAVKSKAFQMSILDIDKNT